MVIAKKFGFIFILWIISYASRAQEIPTPFSLSEYTVEARIQPEDWPVLITPRLVCTVRLEGEQRFLTQAKELKPVRLVQFAGTAIYLLHFPDISSMQAKADAWSAESFITNMQPDFIPLRDKRRDPHYQRVVEQYNANTFDMAAYLSLKEPWAHSQGKKSTIAMIDIAFDLSHPALKQTRVKHSWDIDFDKPGAAPEHNANYEHHGNSIAGVIWSRPRLLQPDLEPYAKGVAWGIAPAASMVALKMQRPWTSAIIRALAQAEEYQADVINISWLLPVVAEPVKRYLAYLTMVARDGTGISVVAAANPQPGVANVGLPLLPNIITVTSTDHQNQLANSSWDQNVDIAAVSYILSVSERNGLYYQRFSKTSASAPVISGFVALLRARYPTLTAQEIEQLLRQQCEHRQQRNISYCAFSAQKVLNALADPGKNKPGTQLQVIKSKEQSF